MKNKPGFSRRLILLLLLPSFFVRAPIEASAQASTTLCESPANSIVAENCKEGTTDWHIENILWDIEGFASLTSVSPGEEIDFYVNTSAESFDLFIYRSGFYSGKGGRLVHEAKKLEGKKQPRCESDSSLGLVDCANWTKPYSLVIPNDWVSGVYIAKLARPDTGGENYMVFVVRESQPQAGMVMQLSVTTYQAYNFYGNKSTYSSLSFDYCPTVTGAARAAKVSFNRPNSLGAYFQNTYFWTDYPMVYWLEAQGYDLGYVTNIDTHRFGLDGNENELLKRRIFLSVGHDEYWTQEMRDAITAARDHGVHLGFFSSNVGYWRMRLEPNLQTGAPDRTMAVYKTSESGPADPSGHATTTWRDPAVNDPENSLIGIQYMGDNDSHYFPLQISAEQAKDSLYRNTPLQDMAPDSFARIGKHIIGWEWDAIADNGRTPASLVVLAESPTTGLILADAGHSYHYGLANAHVTRYVTKNDAIVFGAGTNHWTWGLAIYEPNPIIQQVTYNLFSDMGVQPATPSITLTPDEGESSASKQRQAPVGNDAVMMSAIEEFLRGPGSSDFTFASQSDSAFTVFKKDEVKIPEIKNIQFHPAPDSVTISWETGEPASGQVWIKFASGPVDWSITAEKIGETPVVADALGEAFSNDHEFTISGLMPNREYFFHVSSTNQSGRSVMSEEVNFATPGGGSLSLQAKRYFRPVFRQVRCSISSNPPGIAGIGIVSALVVGVALLQFARRIKRSKSME